MRILPLIVVLLLMSLPCAAEEPVEIPLDQIWALDMPGTKDITKLGEKEAQGNETLSIVSQVKIALRGFHEAKSSPAFAVTGSEKQALTQAASVLSGQSKPSHSINKGETVSIFFFSKLFGAKIAISKVTRQPHVTTVYYRFIRSIDAQQSDHFALIPLGSLTGDMRVEVVKQPMTKASLRLGHEEVNDRTASRIVSQSFSVAIASLNSSTTQEDKIDE